MKEKQNMKENIKTDTHAYCGICLLCKSYDKNPELIKEPGHDRRCGVCTNCREEDLKLRT